MREQNFENSFTSTDWRGQEVSADVMAKLARLMSQENISIEHHNVGTAAFDVKNRTLFLPNWKTISRNIYQLFVTHEVGHALYTPCDGIEEVFSADAGFKGLVNVLEDCRIEKKQKRRFPGAAPQMEAGYLELVERNFFGTQGRELDSYGFIDRVNLASKLGESFGVKFDKDEQILFDRAMATETFEEMLALAHEIWDKKDDLDQGKNPDEDEQNDSDDDDETVDSAPESEETESSDSPPQDSEEQDDEQSDAPSTDAPSDGEERGDEENEDMDSESSEEQDDSDLDSDSSSDGAGEEDADDADEDSDSSSSSDDSDDNDSDGDEEDSGSTGKGGSRGGESVAGGSDWKKEKDAISETDAASQEAQKDFVHHGDHAPSYVTVGDDDTFALENIIVPNKAIRELMHTEFNNSYSRNLATFREAGLQDLKSFKAKNKKAINFLVKEFEMRKAASASQRAAVSTTGVLSTTKLHSYKWNDDIFKKITSIADGKSHGLVLFVDWSGSMQSNMRGTLEQVLTLVLFCQRVNIPFQVFGFSDAYTGNRYFQRTNPDSYGSRQKNLKKGDFKFYDCNLNLLEIATSDTKSKAEKTDMMIALMQIRGHFSHRRNVSFDSTQSIHCFPLPSELQLGGTPLSETIISAIPIVNNFRKAHNLEIVNIVFLTDGEGCDLRDIHESDYSYGSTFVKHNRQHTKIGELRDGKNSAPQMNILIQILRERTNANVCNFYIADPSAGSFKQDVLSSVNIDSREERKAFAKDAFKQAKTAGGVVIENSKQGWDLQMIIMGGKHLTTKTSHGMIVEKKKAVATKRELTKAFTENSNAKLKCRVILQKFVGMIAVEQ